VVTVDDFLTTEECDALVAAAVRGSVGAKGECLLVEKLGCRC
jgi:hypothetical protein